MVNFLLLFGTQFHLPPFCELFDFQDLCFLIFQIIEYRHFALTSIQIIVSEEFNRNLTSDDGLSIVFYLARKHGQGPRVQPVCLSFFNATDQKLSNNSYFLHLITDKTHMVPARYLCPAKVYLRVLLIFYCSIQ